MRLRFILLIAAIWLALAVTASGQEIRSNEWSRGTTLSGFAGVATDNTASGPVLGGTVAWELTRRVALEGGGAWAGFPDSANAFSGTMAVRGRMFGHGRVDPYVAGGVGLYRAEFRAHSPMPAFYARRHPMARARLPEGGATFTDPSLLAGGGINVSVSRHMAFRPDVQAIVVFRDGRRHTVAAVTVHAVFHFEDHPVTPARRGSAARR